MAPCGCSLCMQGLFVRSRSLSLTRLIELSWMYSVQILKRWKFGARESSILIEMMMEKSITLMDVCRLRLSW